MSDQARTEEFLKLEFARQLYDDCMERHGQDHQDTRLLLSYIYSLETRASKAASASGYTYVPA